MKTYWFLENSQVMAYSRIPTLNVPSFNSIQFSMWKLLNVKLEAICKYISKYVKNSDYIQCYSTKCTLRAFISGKLKKQQVFELTFLHDLLILFADTSKFRKTNTQRSTK